MRSPQREGQVPATMANILICDDEGDLAQLIAWNLQKSGHQTRVATAGEEALRLAQERRPDLVVLDLMLPDVTGLEVCRRLKSAPATSGVAVVMLTARSEETDRLAGLELGADDYVTKPFSVRELVLRVGAVLRRAGATAPAQPVVTVGLVRLEPLTHRCFISGEEVTLTLLEFKLLHHLLTRPGQVQSRDALLEHVWGAVNPLETRTVDTHVMRLREKLGPARDYVQTIRGVGYRLTPNSTGGEGAAATDS